ncbi:hypothetical protein ACM3BK_10470 [Mammaliicoccus sciuri]
MNNQEGINTKSNKKKWIWGCGGCLGIFIILAIIFGACSAVFVNSVDEEVNGTKEEQKKNKETSKKDIKLVTMLLSKMCSLNWLMHIILMKEMNSQM